MQARNVAELIERLQKEAGDEMYIDLTGFQNAIDRGAEVALPPPPPDTRAFHFSFDVETATMEAYAVMRTALLPFTESYEVTCFTPDSLTRVLSETELPKSIGINLNGGDWFGVKNAFGPMRGRGRVLDVKIVMHDGRRYKTLGRELAWYARSLTFIDCVVDEGMVEDLVAPCAPHLTAFGYECATDDAEADYMGTEADRAALSRQIEVMRPKLESLYVSGVREPIFDGSKPFPKLKRLVAAGNGAWLDDSS